MNEKPYEVVAGSLELWLAPIGSVYPDVQDTPFLPWAKIGTVGFRDYDDAGVKVAHKTKRELWRSAASNGPVKGWPTEEETTIGLKVADSTLELYKIAMGYNDITAVAAGVGTSGYKKMGLSQSNSLPQRALLLRGTGLSAYMASGNMQYEFPVVVQTGDAQPAFVKGKAVTFDLEFTVLEDPDATVETERLGRIVQQTAAGPSASVSPSASTSPSHSTSPSASSSASPSPSA